MDDGQAGANTKTKTNMDMHRGEVSACETNPGIPHFSGTTAALWIQPRAATNQSSEEHQGWQVRELQGKGSQNRACD